jgi:hypothetical protein
MFERHDLTAYASLSGEDCAFSFERDFAEGYDRFFQWRVPGFEIEAIYLFGALKQDLARIKCLNLELFFWK